MVFLIASLIGTVLLAVIPSGARYRMSEKSKQEEYVIGKSSARLVSIEHWKQSLTRRAAVLNAGFKDFLSSPIVGTGYQNYLDRFGIFSPHNFHVEWLAYGGLLGYLLYVTFIIHHFCRVNGSTLPDPLAANLTALLIIFINALTNSFTNGLIPVVGFLIMGLSQAYLNISKQKNQLTSMA